MPRRLAPDLVDDPANLALACHACNLHKAARTTATDPTSGEETRLFHLRRDDWHEHFGWSIDRVDVVGRTPVGRATTSALQMNAARQRRARAFWLTTDQFP